MIRLLTILFCLLWLTLIAARGQDDKTVCISQESANKCAELARSDKAKTELIAALEAKIATLEADKKELKETAQKNEAILIERLQKTEIALATKTGELIGCEKQGVDQRAIITALVPMLRRKTNGIQIF